MLFSPQFFVFLFCFYNSPVPNSFLFFNLPLFCILLTVFEIFHLFHPAFRQRCMYFTHNRSAVHSAFGNYLQAYCWSRVKRKFGFAHWSVVFTTRVGTETNSTSRIQRCSSLMSSKLTNIRDYLVPYFKHCQTDDTGQLHR